MTDGARRIDVLVVGLGPAGASAARAGAAAGASVVAIDRKREPGKPVQCAEFVPAMLGQEIDFPSAAERQRVEAMTTFVESLPPHTTPGFRGKMIDRAQFDAGLAEGAARAGAECWHGVSLRAVETDGTVMLSDGSRLAPRLLIGADGPRSLVGKLVGRVNVELAETRQITVPLLKPFAETDIFLSACLMGGYAWLFPKADIANLGLGGASCERHRFKPLLDDLHAQLVAQGRVGSQVLAVTGGAIPVGGLLDPAASFGPLTVLLAGDAAGLANPVTGAGIAAAVISGGLAGTAAAAVSAGQSAAADAYREELSDIFGASLRRALDRRRQLLRDHSAARPPSVEALRRGWIAFPEYWAA
jgi:geranylgeranyl reductase family protein